MIMATFESVTIVKQLICGNGEYQGDPIPESIYSYNNPKIPQKKLFMVAYHQVDIINMMNSLYVTNEKLLWDKVEGITEEGKLFLEGLG